MTTTAARRPWSDLAGPCFDALVQLDARTRAVRGRMAPPDHWQLWRRSGDAAVLEADDLPSLEACIARADVKETP